MNSATPEYADEAIRNASAKNFQESSVFPADKRNKVPSLKRFLKWFLDEVLICCGSLFWLRSRW